MCDPTHRPNQAPRGWRGHTKPSASASGARARKERQTERRIDTKLTTELFELGRRVGMLEGQRISHHVQGLLEAFEAGNAELYAASLLVDADDLADEIEAFLEDPPTAP